MQFFNFGKVELTIIFFTKSQENFKKHECIYLCTIFSIFRVLWIARVRFCQFVGVAFKVIRKKGRCKYNAYFSQYNSYWDKNYSKIGTLGQSTCSTLLIFTYSSSDLLAEITKNWIILKLLRNFWEIFCTDFLFNN